MSITFVIAYEMYAANFGLKDEDYGIKKPIPLRTGVGTKVTASNGFEAQSRLTADLKHRFGKDKQVVITSCVSEAAEQIFQRAKKNLNTK